MPTLRSVPESSYCDSTGQCPGKFRLCNTRSVAETSHISEKCMPKRETTEIDANIDKMVPRVEIWLNELQLKNGMWVHRDGTPYDRSKFLAHKSAYLSSTQGRFCPDR